MLVKISVFISVLITLAPATAQTPSEQNTWELPTGWFYVLTYPPESNQPKMFQLSHDEDGAFSKVIKVLTHRNGAILAKNIRYDDLKGTTLRWRWRIHSLPSKVAENTRSTHHYISIAIFFENGIDLSYLWSSELPVETHFKCPSPAYKDKETHVVVRSGDSSLGEWVTEERNIINDYRQYVGGELPAITQIWLIANTASMDGIGKAEFSDISLGKNSDSIERIQIF